MAKQLNQVSVNLAFSADTSQAKSHILELQKLLNNLGTHTANNNKLGLDKELTNALEKAEIYSDFMHMSKSKIYEQLTSEYGENFPSDAAQYAIDNLKADYNANALAKAKDYYEQMHMSKQAVYDQLVSEYGEAFTSEEAQYAIDNL